MAKEEEIFGELNPGFSLWTSAHGFHHYRWKKYEKKVKPFHNHIHISHISCIILDIKSPLKISPACQRTTDGDALGDCYLLLPLFFSSHHSRTTLIRCTQAKLTNNIKWLSRLSHQRSPPTSPCQRRRAPGLPSPSVRGKDWAGRIFKEL